LANKSIHPRAFLTRRRNMKTGVQARSIIITTLEEGPKKTREICKGSGLSYPRVFYHLKLLVGERLIATLVKKRPYVWSLTEYGQQRLLT
jgi:predicted transcriptional regulator